MNTSNVQPVDFENVEDVWFGKIAMAQTVVFKDSMSWLPFGDKYGFIAPEPFDEVPPLPVNFDQEMVIGVFWGRGGLVAGIELKPLRR